MDKSYTTGLAI